jgi:hypothetical protein
MVKRYGGCGVRCDEDGINAEMVGWVEVLVFIICWSFTLLQSQSISAENNIVVPSYEFDQEKGEVVVGWFDVMSIINN